MSSNINQSQHPDRSIKAIQDENRAFYEDLTAKNREYFYKLRKELDERGMNKNQISFQLNPLLKKAFEKQNQGITARRLYGRVQERADLIYYGDSKSSEEDSKNKQDLSADWKLYIDGALFVGGVFTLLSAISTRFTAQPETNQLGLISMIANFLIGGLVMLAITKTAPRPNQKNNYLKYFVASLGSIALWAVVAALINLFVPPALNPALPPSLCLIIGIASLVGKWFFKRHYHVRGGIF